ncbi:hypothetical protein EYB31_24835 [Paenibacillus thalictri]|uniref:Uncharacterized protein n=1 Tax=Paenibacillus thalictri TaxID=2527873 RepID=A0A4Q9DMA9_9BACL|nr:hypothetical protein EYB31_24835 [Paenibacillus thalictri]
MCSNNARWYFRLTGACEGDMYPEYDKGVHGYEYRITERIEEVADWQIAEQRDGHGAEKRKRPLLKSGPDRALFIQRGMILIGGWSPVLIPSPCARVTYRTKKRASRDAGFGLAALRCRLTKALKSPTMTVIPAAR